MELLKKCSDSREKQREDLLTQQSQLQETSEETQRRAAEERDRFMEEIVSFNTEFNLLVDRRTVEENRARAEIEAMQKEEDSLNEDVDTQQEAGGSHKLSESRESNSQSEAINRQCVS
ncbi:hypothetical protein ANANG_G00045780 [Anguilla anguilla]|uniref:Coiled-coil domain-containing protein 172 n=1 Tax=Anguilla anguilla TaxID=7936 RepID=A0A9D3MU68_ANGAN|nr:hypothetical protein ANANG_G00045780 [Anguilla anguilla]